jgi:hypothetical protein
MINRRLMAALLVASIFLGALADLVLGPVFGSGRVESEDLDEVTRSGGEDEPEGRPSLIGVTPPRATSTLDQADVHPVPAALSGPVEAARPRSSLPGVISDVFEALDRHAYRDLFGPVRMHSLVDDLAEVVNAGDRGTWTTGQPLESVARRAALRRGKVRLPADRYLAFGIPVGPRHHEVLIGLLPEVDAGSTSQVLKYLIGEAGLDPRTINSEAASREECLAIAEAFMRDRIQFRAREQEYLARLIASPAGRAQGLNNRFFVLFPGKGAARVVALTIGASPELDSLLEKYIRAPGKVRDEILAKRGR